MGNASSLASAPPDTKYSVFSEEKKAIRRLAQTLDSKSPIDQGTLALSFEYILARYIFQSSADTTGSESPEGRLSQLLYADKYLQTKAVLAFSAIGAATEASGQQTLSLSLYQFVVATCKQAIAGFWQLPLLPADGLDAETEWLARKCLVESKQAIERINGVATDTMSFLVDDSADRDWQMVAEGWVEDTKAAGKVSADAWQIWWQSSPIFRELLNTALSSAIYGECDREIIRGTSLLLAHRPEMWPRGFISDDGNRRSFLLCPTVAWTLGRELPRRSQASWKCVYSSREHGRSWSTFQNRIERQGAILVLIRETRRPESTTEARVFGAYFDSDIDRHPGWTGNSLNFLFVHTSDQHDMLGGLEIYRSSGFNDHFQYFNCGTKTLPNGLGAGGQMEHFGLWIDSGFVRGSSDPAATFESPRLSSQRDFEIDAIEAWLVRPTERLDEGAGGAQKSVMETNSEAAALLELANRKMYSKTVPDQDVDREQAL
ncbi:hypothetical protein LPJ56_000155 [Coemansia sp. RSA 2599]|nr:hypothetical protein LPJ75_000037 [Coemansia sp. RSA 2598]KAJ1829636.1 hypothetical protein LPJ56_000155 [Coemansia sp. RSA 2599]